MTRPEPPKENFDPFAGVFSIRRQWGRERRERIVEEILANRRGEYKVPTWVLAVCLVLMITVIVAVLALY